MESKFCPLMYPYTHINGLCLTNTCAWWDVVNQRCAMLQIAYGLDKIEL